MPKRKCAHPVKKVPYGVIDLTASAKTNDVCTSPTAQKQSKCLPQSEGLKELLNQAAFYVHLTQKNVKAAASTREVPLYIPFGEFKLSVCGGGDVRLQEVTEFWLYVANSPDGQHFLYQEQLIGSQCLAELHYIVEFSSRSVGHCLSSLAVGMSDAFSRSCIQLHFTVDQLGREVTVQMLVDNKYIYDLERWNSYNRIKVKWLHCIQAGLTLAGYTKDLPAVTDEEITAPALPPIPSFHHNIAALFNVVKHKTYLTEEITPQLHVDSESAGVVASTPRGLSKRLLLAKLRRYQEEAVKWMIANEKGLYTAAYTDDICKLFDQLPASNLYMNTDSGVITSHLPRLTLYPGGILADEMGLGKTVEVLTCIVCHPRQDLPAPSSLPASAHVVSHMAPAKPVLSSTKRLKTTVKPVMASVKQTMTGDKPATTGDKQAITGDSQAITGEKQAMTGDKPAATGDKQAATGDSQAITADKQAMTGDKPATTGDKQAITGDSQAITGDKQAITDVKPVMATVESVTSSEAAAMTSEAAAMTSDASAMTSEASAMTSEASAMTSEASAMTVDTAPAKPDVQQTNTNDCTVVSLSSTIEHTLAEATQTAEDSSTATDDALSMVTNSATIHEAVCNEAMPTDDLTVEADNQSKDANYSDTVIEQPAAGSVTDMMQQKGILPKSPTDPMKTTENTKTAAMANSKLSPKFECTCGSFTLDKVIVECILCHLQQHAKCVGYDVTDPYRGEYKCPHCHTISEPIKSGATLIIAPSSIKHQWREEIIKHVGVSHLKILEYGGVTSKSYIQPMTLARQDIVITTYDVLKAELRATNVPHSNSHVGRQLRKPKRFMALPSPLTAVQWWRVCLDEAQMVESVSTRTAEMALKLSAVNRWCVTGTPINSGVDDLFGLLLFLGVAPFSCRVVWDALVYRPYCFGLPNNLHTILRHVMWRTCKADVREELGLPPQTDVMHEVMFSPVEEVFYRQQYSVCRTKCLKILDKYNNKESRLDSLSRHALSEVLQSLLSMRQACCYPEVSREKGRLANAPKLTLTMDELLKHLTQKVKVQTEDAYRCIVAALNGQAACHIIRAEYDKAIENYWEVLHPSVPEYSEIEADTLQRMHANHNLREVLSEMSTHSSMQIDLTELERDADRLASKYVGKLTAAVVAALHNHEEVDVKVYANPLMHEDQLLSGQESVWWIDLFTKTLDPLLRGTDTEADLLHHVHNGVYHSQNTTQITSIQSLDGLMYKLYHDWTKLVGSHTAAKEAILDLHQLKLDADIVDAVANCCLRPGAQLSRTKCLYCKAEELLKKEEYILYDYNRVGWNDSAEVRTGNWTDSVMELAFKAIISYLRQARNMWSTSEMDTKEQLKEYRVLATEHMALFDLMKRQFKLLRILWRHMRDRIAAIDEMSMGKTRFRLRHSWEPFGVGSAEVLEEYEVADLYQKQISDMAAGKADFAAAERQHNYLKHIGSLPMNDAVGNTELCPICQQTLGHSWAVLSCCHSFCIDCIHVLSHSRSILHSALRLRQSIRCAVCRKDTRRQNLSYVSSGRAVNLANEGIKVEGNYSSKVMEVVRCLKVIERDEPNAKALVFSSWTSLLEVVAKALYDNNITYQDLTGKCGRNYEKKLNSFRCGTGIEALLLPIASGANGLNLTEATHVLLLEPLLHAGREAQAIGRVHRIGQTKPTFVHRFIVRHTIEQQIHSIMSTLPSGASADGLVEEMPFTIADLAAMFDSSA